MADETPSATTQYADAPNHQSRKHEHMSKIANLADGHRYTLEYFPEELQSLLNMAALKFHKWSPGHFTSVLGWSRESRQKSKPDLPPLQSQPLEIHWSGSQRTVLLADWSIPSDENVESEAMIADTEQVLSRLKRGVDFAPPFSTIVGVVDDEHVVLLSVFFRYCVLVQGYETAVQGFPYDFWLWFEKLCRHVAKQDLLAVSPGNADAATSAMAGTEMESACGQADTEERAYRDKTTVLENEGGEG